MLAKAGTVEVLVCDPPSPNEILVNLVQHGPSSNIVEGRRILGRKEARNDDVSLVLEAKANPDRHHDPCWVLE